EGRRGRGRRAGDSRQGPGAGRGQQAPAAGAHAAPHPEQGDRAVERHAPTVHGRRGTSLSQPEGPGRREWRGAFYSPRALRHGRDGEDLAPRAGLRCPGLATPRIEFIALGKPEGQGAREGSPSAATRAGRERLKGGGAPPTRTTP